MTLRSAPIKLQGIKLVLIVSLKNFFKVASGLEQGLPWEKLQDFSIVVKEVSGHLVGLSKAGSSSDL